MAPCRLCGLLYVRAGLLTGARSDHGSRKRRPNHIQNLGSTSHCVIPGTPASSADGSGGVALITSYGRCLRRVKVQVSRIRCDAPHTPRVCLLLIYHCGGPLCTRTGRRVRCRIVRKDDSHAWHSRQQTACEQPGLDSLRLILDAGDPFSCFLHQAQCMRCQASFISEPLACAQYSYVTRCCARRLEQAMLEAYQADGWRGANRERFKPTADLDRARRQVDTGFRVKGSGSGFWRQRGLSSGRRGRPLEVWPTARREVAG